MVEVWWSLLGATVPILLAGQAIRTKARYAEEQRLKSARVREKTTEDVFVCERVCTSKRMLKKVGAFSKDPIPDTCVTVCGVSELDACSDACARTVCVNQHQVPNWNDVCLRRCQSEKKRTRGRCKIEIKKIEKKTSLQVAFSKRRTGLFKKAGELVALCGSEIAIMVTSPAKKFFTFGSPSVECVLHRIETGIDMNSCSNCSNAAGQDEYVMAMRKLEAEKEMMRKDAIVGATDFWWDQPIEGMEFEELERHVECLKVLRSNVQCKVEEIEKMNCLATFPVDHDQSLENCTEVQLSPSPPSPPPPPHDLEIQSLDGSTMNEETSDWMTAFAELMKDDFPCFSSDFDFGLCE